MLGLIQNLLLRLVEERTGSQGRNAVLEGAGVPLSRLFRIGEDYPDVEFQRLLQSALRVTGLDEGRFLTAYAELFFRDARERWPAWFTSSPHSRSFIEKQCAIHNIFASGLGDQGARAAVADKFRVERHADRILTHYRSPNRLCGLYKALALRVVDYYGDSVEIMEHRCMHRGDEECEIELRWSSFKGGTDGVREPLLSQR